MLAKRAERIDKKLKQSPRGVIPILEIFQLVLGFLSACKKPPTPAPVNPTPNPTPAQTAAWDDAWTLKQKAIEAQKPNGTFGGAGFNRTVKETLQKKRRDGEKIKRAAAEEVVSEMFADAVIDSMPSIYSDVCEARHVA